MQAERTSARNEWVGQWTTTPPNKGHTSEGDSKIELLVPPPPSSAATPADTGSIPYTLHREVLLVTKNREDHPRKGAKLISLSRRRSRPSTEKEGLLDSLVDI